MLDAHRDRERLKAVFNSVVEQMIRQGTLPGFESRGISVAWRRPVRLAQEIMMRLPREGTLLDIGTGYGIIPRIISSLGNRVVAIDSPDISGDEPLRRLLEAGIECHPCTVGEEPIPLPDASVDVAFAGDVVEHIPHSPKPFMEEIRRVLKPGGYLVMDTPNAVGLKTRLKMAVGIPNWPTLNGIYHEPRNVHHHKEYTRAELVELFQLAGFTSIAVHYYEQFWQLSLKRLGALRQMGAAADEMTQYGTGFHPLKPYEYFRLLCLGLSWAMPSLRSSIVGAGRKRPA